MPYNFYSTITIDHAQVTSSGSTYFRFQFQGGAAFANRAHGGTLFDANGYDLIFSSSNPCIAITPLAFELVPGTYDQTTGLGEWWVRIPYPSHTVDSIIWVVYSNITINTYQGNTPVVWSNVFNEYLSVNHWQSASGHQGDDSTSGANNMDNIDGGGILTTAPGLFNGQAWQSNGVAGAYANDVNLGYPGANPPFPGFLGPFTVQAWVKFSGSIGSQASVAGVGGNASNGRALILAENTAILIDTDAADPQVAWTRDNNWHFVVVTGPLNVTANNLSFYLDGVLQTLTKPSSTPLAMASSGHNWTIGCIPGATGSGTFTPNGTLIDDSRLANIQWDAGLIATEYNNQKLNSTFYTTGPEQTFNTSGQCVIDISCAELVQGSVGLAYSAPILASNGTAPYIFSIIDGTLPPGLTLNATTGVVSGVPAANGTFDFTVGVADST